MSSIVVSTTLVHPLASLDVAGAALVARPRAEVSYHVALSPHLDDRATALLEAARW